VTTTRPKAGETANPLSSAMTSSQHVYKIRPRKSRRGVDLISYALPFGALWYAGPGAIDNAIGYAKFRSPVTHCRHSHVRRSWQRDRDARARGRFQRVVKVARVSHWRKTNRLRNYVP